MDESVSKRCRHVTPIRLGSHALYLIFNITLFNVNLFLIQGANTVVVVVVYYKQPVKFLVVEVNGM